METSLKILHILDHSLPIHSGYSFRTHSILRAQRKRGWSPLAVTSMRHVENWGGPVAACEDIEGFRYYRTAKTNSGFGSIFRELKLIHKLSSRIEEVLLAEKPDILHAHSPVLNAMAALRVAKSHGLPLVYEIRAFWEDAAVDHGSYAPNSLKYGAIKFAETRICHRADHITVLCNGIRSDLANRGIPTDKMTVIFNGIDPEELIGNKQNSPGRKSWNVDGRTVIGFIGSFYRYEGLDLLVKATAELARSRPDILLLLVGTGEVESELRNLADRLKLSGNILFAGRVEHGDILTVYQLADVLVYPRYSNRLTELVTPLKPLEAMALGKPVVASDIGGHRELIQHGRTGYLFEPGNLTALVEVLDKVLRVREAGEALGNTAFRWVRDFHSWDRTTEPYAAVYAKVLARHR